MHRLVRTTRAERIGRLAARARDSRIKRADTEAEKRMSTLLVRAWAAITLALLSAAGFSPLTQAQTKDRRQLPSLVKPPAGASGAASTTNPDNMPIKKPTRPTHDNMSRDVPASAAKAK